MTTTAVSTTAALLVRPAPEHLASYVDALRRGFSPNTERDDARFEQLERIEADSERFLALMDDVAAEGPPVTLPDGSTVPRMPGRVRWLWEQGPDGGAFVGSIGLRWQRDARPTPESMPPHCLGHIGYSVVAWARGRGLATRALAELLPLARSIPLAHVDLTTDRDNAASQRVIEKNGGTLLDTPEKPPTLGGGTLLRYRIVL